jgi:uncharacterized protein (TIGR02466 family)
MTQLETTFHFPSAVYTVSKPEFLDVTKKVTSEYLEKAKTNQWLDEIYPLYTTDDFFHDERLESFCRFIGETSWMILSDQGHNMEFFNVEFMNLWCQQHQKYSGQEEHVHNSGSQISGFYFIDCPDKCSRALIHDPRPAKRYALFMETDVTQLSYASQTVAIEPKPGLFVFTNSWLPHSFTKNGSNTPFTFIHFNMSVSYRPPSENTVEVI